MNRRLCGQEKPRVFISHSATGDTQVEQLVTRLENQLADKYAILVDRDLHKGYPWRETLNTWIGACDAAVVLLSEKALRSEFVAYEVGILTYRAKYVSERRCKVIPVFVDPVDYIAVQRAKGFGPAQISETEAITAKTEAEVIEQVKNALTGVACADTPLD